MNIGSLNKRIELQASTAVADGMGGQTLTWATSKTVFAAIWPTSAAERVESGQTTLTVTHRIRIRYDSSVSPAWRVKFGTRYFSIVSLVNPNEKNALLDLLCREVDT